MSSSALLTPVPPPLPPPPSPPAAVANNSLPPSYWSYLIIEITAFRSLLGIGCTLMSSSSPPPPPRRRVGPDMSTNKCSLEVCHSPTIRCRFFDDYLSDGTHRSYVEDFVLDLYTHDGFESTRQRVSCCVARDLGLFHGERRRLARTAVLLLVMECCSS